MFDGTDAPHSAEEVQQVVRDLRVMDPLLGIRWEPRAVMTKRGGYDGAGKVINPEWRGLWEIVRDDKAFGTAPWRSWTRVCFVTEPVEVAPGLKAMVQDGAYAQVGPWVVEFMRQADQHNLEEARRLQQKLDRLNEQADAAAARAGEDGEREAMERMYHAGTKAGGGVSEFHAVGAISFGKGYKSE